MKNINIVITDRNNTTEEIVLSCLPDNAVEMSGKNIIIGENKDLIIPINEVSRIEIWSDDWDERYNVFEF